MIYPYECTNKECVNCWEVEQSIKDDKIKVCPKCKQETAKRVIGKTSFVLKGGSWAKDNYR